MHCYLKSSYQEGRVGIQLSRRKGWDPVIKKGGLGSSYQEGRVGIQLSRRKGWDPINLFNPTTLFSDSITGVMVCMIAAYVVYHGF
jgi:hypothetical protein